MTKNWKPKNLNKFRDKLKPKEKIQNKLKKLKYLQIYIGNSMEIKNSSDRKASFRKKILEKRRRNVEKM